VGGRLSLLLGVGRSLLARSLGEEGWVSPSCSTYSEHGGSDGDGDGEEINGDGAVTCLRRSVPSVSAEGSFPFRAESSVGRGTARGHICIRGREFRDASTLMLPPRRHRG
jgi:hypothetical protein